MKIALDIDDTISRHPEFFSVMTGAFRAAGHEVLVISFRTERQPTEEELLGWGIAYDELILCDGSAPIDGIDAWKGRICAERGVHIFFEDDPIVLHNVGPQTVCFMAVDRDSHDLEACGRNLWYRNPG